MRGKNIENNYWIERCLKNALPLIIYTYRNYHKISQTELAVLLDTDQAVVSRLENGRQEPSLTILLYFSQRIPYGINLVKLLDPRMVRVISLIGRRVKSFNRPSASQDKFQSMLKSYENFLVDYNKYKNDSQYPLVA